MAEAQAAGITLPRRAHARAARGHVERAQLMIESAQCLPLQRFLSAAQTTWFMLAQQHRRSGLIRWAVDVDPLSI